MLFTILWTIQLEADSASCEVKVRCREIKVEASNKQVLHDILFVCLSVCARTVHNFLTPSLLNRIQ